jgi:S-adenosylmethionine hydrolase
MILTVTDFGREGPCLGLMRAALRSAGAECEIIDLVSDDVVALWFCSAMKAERAVTTHFSPRYGRFVGR